MPCVFVWCISGGNVGFGRTPRELSGLDVVIGAQQRALVMLPQLLWYLPVIRALPVSNNQDKLSNTRIRCQVCRPNSQA